MQWQPDGLTIRAKKRFLGAGFLGAPPISHRSPGVEAPGAAAGGTVDAAAAQGAVVGEVEVEVEVVVVVVVVVVVAAVVVVVVVVNNTDK